MVTKTLYTALAFASAAAQAETCTDFASCAKAMYSLTGERYIWEEPLESFRLGSSPNVEITRENADLIFTALLDQKGYARVPVGDGNTFRIVRANERKEMDMPTLEASSERAPEIPNTWDWVMMRYKLKSPQRAREIGQEFRRYMPGASLFNGDERSGYINVAAPAPSVKRMYGLLRATEMAESSGTPSTSASPEPTKTN